MNERVVGHISHFYPQASAAAVTLDEPLRVGDRIHVVGHTTDLLMTVDRMQIDHGDVREAKPGEDVAVHVSDKVREHDEVRKLEG